MADSDPRSVARASVLVISGHSVFSGSEVEARRDQVANAKRNCVDLHGWNRQHSSNVV